MRFVYDVSGSGCGEFNSTAVPVASNPDQTLNNSIMSLLSSEFDTTDVYRPHAYLVWMFYDQNMNLDVANSGAAKVENPNALETIIRNDLDVSKDGYLHTYVSNGSEAKVNFDNFLVQYQRGQLRQINDYYPYGLTIAGLNSNSDEYLNKYTTKELQTGEFDASLSTGLEMFDFGSRFYDPQLGVWFTPDPAEQFHNPYLGIGNNPVMYVDPDGEFIFTALIPGAGLFIDAALWGAVIGSAGYTANVAFSDGGFQNFDWGQFGKSAGIGALSGVATAGIGQAFGAVGSNGLVGELGRAYTHGFAQGTISEFTGGDFIQGFAAGGLGSLGGSAFGHFGGDFAQSLGGNVGFSALTGGIGAEISGGDFWRGAASGATIGLLNHGAHIQKHNQQAKLQVKASRAFLEDLGYSSDQVARDVLAHRKGGIFSKKYAKLLRFALYEDSFTSGHYDSLNEDYSAFLSTAQSAGGAHFQMKYYPGRHNSVGLIQTGAGHYFESAMELIDGRVRDWTGRDNMFYHMHEGNALEYLFRTGRLMR